MAAPSDPADLPALIGSAVRVLHETGILGFFILAGLTSYFRIWVWAYQLDEAQARIKALETEVSTLRTAAMERATIWPESRRESLRAEMAYPGIEGC